MITAGTMDKRRARALNRMRAKDMRHTPVSMEKLFWSFVRNRQIDGFKFKRQVLIGPYIADFVCLERKLVVELDGPHHADRKGYDAARDAYLRKRGFRILRFENDYFAGDAGIVFMMLRRALEISPSP